MGSLLSLSLLGFALGLRHATDPDHVVAVSTIVSRQRSVWTSGRIGALWGAGHTLSVLVAGGGMILLEISLSQRTQLGLEMGVAIMLVVLGLLNLLGSHETARTQSSVRPVLVGIVHGLAGTATVTLAIIPLIPSPAWSIGYLVLFGLGTIA